MTDMTMDDREHLEKMFDGIVNWVRSVRAYDSGAVMLDYGGSYMEDVARALQHFAREDGDTAWSSDGAIEDRAARYATRLLIAHADHWDTLTGHEIFNAEHAHDDDEAE